MPTGLRPWAGDLPCRQAVHDAWIVLGRAGPPTDLDNPAPGNNGQETVATMAGRQGWEGDAKLQAIMLPAPRGYILQVKDAHAGRT